MCYARSVHIVDFFKLQCNPVVYDCLHWKAQTGKGEPTYTNYIMYIYSIDIDWLNPSGVKRIKNILSLLKTKMTNLIHMIQRYED